MLSSAATTMAMMHSSIFRKDYVSTYMYVQTEYSKPVDVSPNPVLGYQLTLTFGRAATVANTPLRGVPDAMRRPHQTPLSGKRRVT